MHFIVTVFVVLMAASSAFAQAEPVKRVTRTVETGGVAAIKGTASSCSVPKITRSNTPSSVSSRFSYDVCVEYATYQADVTGKSWNTKDAEVPGTRRVFYRLESSYVNKYESVSRPDKDDPPGTYERELAMETVEVVDECNDSRESIVAESVDLSETGCAE